MSVRRWALCMSVGIVAVSAAPNGQPPVVLTSVVTTSALHNYEGAPATPDADDPAIWVNRRNPQQSLLIGTAN